MIAEVPFVVHQIQRHRCLKHLKAKRDFARTRRDCRMSLGSCQILHEHAANIPECTPNFLLFR